MGGSPVTLDTGWPFAFRSYVPGQKKLQYGNFSAWRSLVASGPSHGCGHNAKAGMPHLRSAVMLSGECSAVFGSLTGWPDHHGRLPIWPMRITTTSTMYIANAR